MSSKTKHKILLVEDEEAIRTGLVDVLVFHGYDVTAVADGRAGLEVALGGKFDLLILDVMLPGLDGFSICNEVRKTNRDVAIVMLTAKTSDEDIVNGLTLGADDYVGKPFSVRQLILRIEAVLRRFRKHQDQPMKLQLGGLTIDIANLTGSRAGSAQLVDFSRRELELLCFLHSHSARPVTREELLDQVWGYARANNIETRTVDIHIAKLRKKIESDAKNPEYLVTVRGEGYRLLGALEV